MKIKRGLSVVLCVALAVSCFLPVGKASLAAKAKLSVKKLSVSVGAKKSIKLKNKIKKATYSFKSSNKKVCTVNKKGVVTGKAAGTAKVTVNEKYKKKTSKVGVVKVTVTGADGSDGSGSGSGANGSGSANNGTGNGTNTGTNPGTNTGTNGNGSNDGSNGGANGGAEQNADNPTAAPEATEAPTPEPTAIVYPTSHDAPNGFDSKQNGVKYGTVTKKQYYSSVTGRNRNVNVITPPDYDENEKYPVIYLLHGIGGNEDEWLGGNPNEIVNNLVSKGESSKMIIVIPNIRAGADDSNSGNQYSLENYKKFDNFINDLRDCLMPWMEENYSVATGRENTAIAGLSMGARESLYIGFNMPETFGYTGAFSPGYGVFAYTANGVSEEGMFTEETFTLPDEWKDITYIQIVNGISEGGESALGGTCSNVLKSHGVNHWFYTTPGAHDFQTWKNGLYNMAKNIFK